MSGIFDEGNMRQVLSRSIPDGETLLAGIHAVAKESQAVGLFRQCAIKEDRLIPDEHGGAVSLTKTKYAVHDIYFGITQHFLVLDECEPNQHLYQAEPVPDTPAAAPVLSELLFSEFGTCFPLADIRSCTLKKGWMGSVNCLLTMENGSRFKLMFPKLGGLGGRMPHHAEYRDAILARLRGAGEDAGGR